ncbi:MAG TPA: 5-oxoprolinase subunit PxpB, partial [bacterium]|nr:5-oxoprolinase subunit PxpB [bacterium]
MRVLPLGERGLLIEIGDVLDPAINAQVRALAHRLAGMPGVEEVVPALRSVLVVVDPLAADPGLIAEKAEAALPALRGAVAEGGRRVEVPVLYGGEAGPDLEEVAAAAGLSVAQAARMHAEGEYTVYMLGFRPGFPYLGVLPEPLRVPRLASPRARVPAGSIGVADALSGIYPLTSPGGWRLIGRTPLSIYDPTAADPILLRPGDRVRFSPIDAATFADPSPPGPLPVPSRPAF